MFNVQKKKPFVPMIKSDKCWSTYPAHQFIVHRSYNYWCNKEDQTKQLDTNKYIL